MKVKCPIPAPDAVVWIEWADWDKANMTNKRILNREQNPIKEGKRSSKKMLIKSVDDYKKNSSYW